MRVRILFAAQVVCVHAQLVAPKDSSCTSVTFVEFSARL